MRTLSTTELNTVAGGFFLHCKKPMMKPKCMPAPKPKMNCFALIAKLKVRCGTPAPTPEDDPIIIEG